MSLNAKALCGVLLALTLGGPARAQDNADYRSAVEGTARELGRQLELLQDAIVDEPLNLPGKQLWQRSEDTVLFLVHFRKDLGNGAPRAQLYQDYDLMDAKMRDLLGDIAILGQQARQVHRAAARVLAAEQELHFALVGNDKGNNRRLQALRTQALAFMAAAQDLERTAKYILGGEGAWGTLSPDFRALRQAADAFNKNLQGEVDFKKLPEQFAALKLAWENLTVDFGLLQPGNSLLLRSFGSRLDAITARLYGLVGVQGTSPRLYGGG